MSPTGKSPRCLESVAGPLQVGGILRAGDAARVRLSRSHSGVFPPCVVFRSLGVRGPRAAAAYVEKYAFSGMGREAPTRGPRSDEKRAEAKKRPHQGDPADGDCWWVGGGIYFGGPAKVFSIHPRHSTAISANGSSADIAAGQKPRPLGGGYPRGRP